ncbi:hypothetical protein FOCC_FOCC012832 [Frankliniella occidentalis]|uniref:Fl(2)d-associated complex component isoform X2 n=1 Tax=Frankliniella occidentalis TaxID=133901 RepID=A0A6J1SDN6_FRAOC|nr:fl(2)d-associated complex component isoform X2 [Frankliniella occidentalis]KAE8741630.1 hypothetical protein FOCC_FOCC012832 [Frankliniella occidentalis]
MSKQQTRRKISLDSPLKQVHSNPIKDSPRRPSVFERLGTKAISSNPSQCPANVKPTDSFCRQWEQNGTCQYGKNCKYVSTHALISPSKRAAIKDASSKINNKSCSSSSTSGSSSTGSDSTSSEETSSTGSSESVESSRHHRHKAKHLSTRKVKRYSSSSDKEHIKRNNIRTGKGISPSKKSAHCSSVANVSNLHREMKHSKKRRSRDRSDGHSSPRKGGPGTTSGSKKSLSPPVFSSNANIHKRRSQSPLLKGGKQTVSTSKLGLGGRNAVSQHNARSPPGGLKDKHNRSVSPRSRERERNREKEEKERERDADREREREKEREKDREKDRDRDKRQREKEREPEKLREREKERDKDRNRSRSPKLKLKDGTSRSPRKEIKRKESPDHHSKSNRLSGGSQKGRDDNLSSKHKVSPSDNWHRENRKDDKEEERKRVDDRRHKEDLRKDVRPLEDKDHMRDRERERMHDREREKDKSKTQQGIPSLLTLNLQHNPNDFSPHVGGGVKERGAERNRSLERTGHIRNLSIDRGRERSLDRMSERSRGSERDRRCRNNNGGLEKGLDHSGLEKELAKALARNREQERTFERNERLQERVLDRGLDRNPERGLERSLDRGLDRGLERGLERGLDRGLERGLDRGHESRLDRSHERGIDRCLDRGLKGDRGLDRGSPRVMDRENERSLERGLDRDPVHGRLERGVERSLERPALERGSPRLDRDHRFSERSPGDRLFGAGHMDHNREQDEKSFDNSFEGRRERGRFSDQARYDKGAPSNDDRRLGPPDMAVFSEERRRGRDGGRQEVRGGQWEARNDRKRDHNHERDHGRERDHGPRGYDGGPRPSGPNNPGKRNDWEWEGRGRRSGKDWDGPHRNDNAPLDKEWNRFPPNQGDWSGDRRSGGWNDEWRQPANQATNPVVQPLLNRPPGRMLPLRDDSQNSTALKPEEHILDENSKAKDQSGPAHEAKNEVKIDGAATVCENSNNLPSNHKRVREVADGEETSAENKRLLLEKDSALEEVLSDISDDADEILNREDSELNHTNHGETIGVLEKETPQGNIQSSLPPQSGPHGHGSGSHRRTVDGAEGVGNLGFEEISDGELEEEARARGISDALGVDWASLVAETRPRAKIDKAGSTRQRWEGVRLLTYIGVSVEYAGPKLVKYLLKSAFNPPSDPSIMSTESTLIKTINLETSRDSNKHSKENEPSGSENPSCQVTGKSMETSEPTKKSDDDVNESRNKSEIYDRQIDTNDTIKIESSTILESGFKSGTESISLQARKSDPSAESKGKTADNVKEGKVEDSKVINNVKQENSVGERTGETDQILGNLFCEKLLHPVAGIHTALLERRARRQALFNCSGPYKRALSARRDLSIRRQLCSLPMRETTCDNGPAVDELYRLSLQMLERAS